MRRAAARVNNSIARQRPLGIHVSASTAVDGDKIRALDPTTSESCSGQGQVI